jgi:hypothetical protein
MIIRVVRCNCNKSSRQISNNRRITIGSDKLMNLLRDKPLEITEAD